MQPHQEATTKGDVLGFGELAMVFSLYLLIYSLTLSRVPSATTDSINYINTIDSGVHLFHPHHLLYNSLARMWIVLWRTLGVHIDSEILASELNAIFGALGLCAFYGIVRMRLGCNRGIALLATALPAFSFGFWYYSGCVDVYIIPLFFLLTAFYYLTAEHVDSTVFILAGFLNGIAVIVAEISVLFAAVVLLAAWYSHRRGDSPLGKSLRNYVLTASPTAALPYLWVFFSRASPSQSVVDWLAGYAHNPKYWSALSVSSIFQAVIGLGQAFVGMHFLFALPVVRLWLESNLRGFYLTNDVYLVRNLGPGVASLLLICSLVLCLIVVIAGGVSVAKISALPVQKRRLVCLSLVWTCAYGIFILFYVASNAKYWIAPSVCLWIVFLAFWLDSANRRAPYLWARGVVAIVVALMFVVNFGGSIRFTRNRKNDYYYSQIQPLLSVSNANDLIVIGRSWKLEGYLLRYGRVKVVALTSICESSDGSPERFRQVESAIDDELAAGGRVLISREAIALEPETIRNYPGITSFQTLWNDYRQRWIVKEFPETAVYVLEPMNADCLEPRHETCAARFGN